MNWKYQTQNMRLKQIWVKINNEQKQILITSKASFCVGWFSWRYSGIHILIWKHMWTWTSIKLLTKSVSNFLMKPYIASYMHIQNIRHRKYLRYLIHNDFNLKRNIYTLNFKLIFIDFLSHITKQFIFTKLANKHHIYQIP